MTKVPDLPDDFQFMADSERSPMIDMGELAVRLGSIVNFDRRGEVVYMDSFAYGMQGWKLTAYVGSNTAAITTEKPLHKGYALKMTDDGSVDGYLEINRTIVPPLVNKWGMELAWCAPTDYTYIAMELRRIIDTKYYGMYVKIDEANSKLQITDNGAVTDIATLDQTWAATGFYNHLKIVGDFDSNKHVRLIFNQVEYDTSAYALTEITVPAGFWNDMFVHFNGREGQTDYTILGHVIVTANEP